MADKPQATLTIDDQAGATGGGTGYAVVFSCVEKNADLTPRVMVSKKSVQAQHGYSQGADYTAIHVEKTGKPVIFVGLPTATPGVLRYLDTSAVTGTSKMRAVAGAAGFLEEVDGSFEITKGGVIGTDPIEGQLSCDGERTTKKIRLGTGTSYAVPSLGIILQFGVGTVAVGDVVRFRTTAPMWDADGLAQARTALSRQQKLARSFVIIGDLPSSTFAQFVLTETNGYETANKRFVYSRCSVRDGGPPSMLAKSSKVKKMMSGNPTLTFAEVGASGDTITRSAGSFLDDGFAVGDVITVAGSVSNNVTGPIASLTDLVITFGTTDLAAEATVANCTIVGSPGFTFAEVGATSDTITRSSGSWIDEGFKVGDPVAVTGTASNNVSGPLTAVSATVLTFGTTDLAPEVIASHLVTVKKVETMVAAVSSAEAAFAVIDDQRRIDLSWGRLAKQSPITGWFLRRPASWATSVREYEHDVHIATWEKERGVLDGWLLSDADGNLVEYDEENDGGALAARFTCAGTFANGPIGAFIKLSLTRAPEGSLLSRTHNMAVADVACTICHAETENAIGKSLVLGADGTALPESLSLIANRVNRELQQALLREKVAGEGQRASNVLWVPNTDDVFDVPEATLNGVLFLELNGTLEKINTIVKVQTGG